MSTQRIKLFKKGTGKYSRYPKGDAMNKTCAKWTADAAKYFKEEVLDIMPDIPGDELSEMVGEYIYYQDADVSKDMATEVVGKTCVKR
jgi:hypothetical protein